MESELPRNQVTQLLQAWGKGDSGALERLTLLVHKELHRLAHGYMARERKDHTLQTTALVHEAFLRLVDAREVNWRDRTHFFAISARIMRRILVDWAVARRCCKRGGGAVHVSLEESRVLGREPGAELVALDEALERLAAFDPRRAQTVELRFFGGLSVKEAAEVMKVSPETVARDWRAARAWLYRELSGVDPHAA